MYLIVVKNNAFEPLRKKYFYEPPYYLLAINYSYMLYIPVGLHASTSINKRKHEKSASLADLKLLVRKRIQNNVIRKCLRTENPTPFHSNTR